MSIVFQIGLTVMLQLVRDLDVAMMMDRSSDRLLSFSAGGSSCRDFSGFLFWLPLLFVSLHYWLYPKAFSRHHIALPTS